MTTTKRKLVRVTAEDIKGGVARCGNRCPVILAVKRTFRLDDAYTDGKVIHILGWGRESPLDLPAPARRFVADLDAGRDAGPFAFYLRISEVFLRRRYGAHSR